MRLINVKTLEMHEFFGNDTPRYAILSHTWGKDEISFQDWQAALELPQLIAACQSTGATSLDAYTILRQRRFDELTTKAGYHKIISFCRLVRQGLDFWDTGPLEWVWADTCCIDKRSSSELSEAINSMFRWYRDSEICVAYLSDVPSNVDHYANDSAFRASKWFTRGWTLQELLAPKKLRFYSSDWVMILDKADKDAASLVSDITNIHIRYLNPSGPYLLPSSPCDVMYTASVSERMSWASARTTTRPEDMAYCLLGIFKIHMPMLYGEGHQAFVRLQEEIIRNSTDQTIFAWGFEMPLGPVGTDGALRGHFSQLLAPSPVWFRNGDQFDVLESDTGPSFHLTNSGLHIPLYLYRCKDVTPPIFLARFPNCVSVTGGPVGFHVTIPGLDESTTDIPDGAVLTRLRGGAPIKIHPDDLDYQHHIVRNVSILRFGQLIPGNKRLSIRIPRTICSFSQERAVLCEIFPPPYDIAVHASSNSWVVMYDSILRSHPSVRVGGGYLCLLKYIGTHLGQFIIGVRIQDPDNASLTLDSETRWQLIASLRPVDSRFSLESYFCGLGDIGSWDWHTGRATLDIECPIRDVELGGQPAAGVKSTYQIMAPQTLTVTRRGHQIIAKILPRDPPSVPRDP